MNAEERLAYLLEIVETRKPADASKNDTAWATGARGIRDFGPGPLGWAGMLEALNAIGYSDVANQLTNGMDFGDPKSQVMLDQLGQVNPQVFTPERVAVMKAWGVIRRPRWQIEGYPAEPTLEFIAEELQAKETEDWWRRLSVVVRDGLFDKRIKTKADIISIIENS